MSNSCDGEWLVPFKGRNYSGAYNQNFLWRRESLYVMDNHRAALWCWLQHLDLDRQHSIFHIDRHTDALQSRLQTWLGNLPPAWKTMSIDEYLEHSYTAAEVGIPLRLFSWDNYLSIYLATFGSKIRRCYFATHRDGDDPNHEGVLPADMWDIPTNMEFWLEEKEKPWIMNIDLDYFFWHDDEKTGLMVSDAFMKRCFEPIRQKIEDGTIAVTTICLTPDEQFTGGWKPSERLAQRILKMLGVEFQLPKNPKH